MISLRIYSGIKKIYKNSSSRGGSRGNNKRRKRGEKNRRKKALYRARGRVLGGPKSPNLRPVRKRV